MPYLTENTDDSLLCRLVINSQLRLLPLVAQILNLDFEKEFANHPKIFTLVPGAMRHGIINLMKGWITKQASYSIPEGFKADPAKLNQIAKQIFFRDPSSKKHGVAVGVGNLEGAPIKDIMAVLNQTISTLPSKTLDPQPEYNYQLSEEHIYKELPKNVTANMIVLRIPRGEQHKGLVLGNFLLERIHLRNKFEKDSLLATGYFARASSGSIFLAHERDMKCGETIDLFIQAGNFLEKLELSDEELESYKVRMFQKKPFNVHEYLVDDLISKKDEKTQREEISTTSLADIQKYGRFLKEAITKGVFYVEADPTCLKEAKEGVESLKSGSTAESKSGSESEMKPESDSEKGESEKADSEKADSEKADSENEAESEPENNSGDEPEEEPEKKSC